MGRPPPPDPAQAAIDAVLAGGSLDTGVVGQQHGLAINARETPDEDPSNRNPLNHGPSYWDLAGNLAMSLIPAGGAVGRLGTAAPGAASKALVPYSRMAVGQGKSAAAAAGTRGGGFVADAAGEVAAPTLLTRGHQAMNAAMGAPGTKRRLLSELGVGLGVVSTALSAEKAMSEVTRLGMGKLRDEVKAEGTPEALEVAAEILTPQPPSDDPELAASHDRMLGANSRAVQGMGGVGPHGPPRPEQEYEDPPALKVFKDKVGGRFDDDRARARSKGQRLFDMIEVAAAQARESGRLSESEIERQRAAKWLEINEAMHAEIEAINDAEDQFYLNNVLPMELEFGLKHQESEQARLDEFYNPEPPDHVGDYKNAQAAVDHMTLQDEQAEAAYTQSPMWQGFVQTEMAALPTYQQYVNSGELNAQTLSLLQRWVPSLAGGPTAAMEAMGEIISKPNLIFDPARTDSITGETSGHDADAQAEITNTVVGEFMQIVAQIMGQAPQA